MIAPPLDSPTPTWPRWIADLRRLLGIRPQFLLSGPIRDLFLTPLAGQTVLLPILDSLWEALALHGYQYWSKSYARY